MKRSADQCLPSKSSHKKSYIADEVRAYICESDDDELNFDSDYHDSWQWVSEDDDIISEGEDRPVKKNLVRIL